MTNRRDILFGVGLETGVHQVSDMLRHARRADLAGLDIVTLSDHPFFAERIDAYAALAYVLGATTTVRAAAIMTNLLSRPAPILARTATGLATVSSGRFVLGVGAGGLWPEIVALGVPQLSPAARVRALEEAITLIRALAGGGDPITFDGEFYQVSDLQPAEVPAAPIWLGALGPKTLAVTGRHADGWIPGHLADWRSRLVTQSRPIIDEAAASVGRDSAEIATIYNVTGRITQETLPQTRDDEGNWIGGGLTQWIEELAVAVLDHDAAAFIYLVEPGALIDDTTFRRWTEEVVPGVREALDS